MARRHQRREALQSVSVTRPSSSATSRPFASGGRSTYRHNRSSAPRSFAPMDTPACSVYPSHAAHSDDQFVGIDSSGGFRCVSPSTTPWGIEGLLPDCSSGATLVSEGFGRWKCVDW